MDCFICIPFSPYLACYNSPIFVVIADSGGVLGRLVVVIAVVLLGLDFLHAGHVHLVYSCQRDFAKCAFTFSNLIRHYAKQAVKHGGRRKIGTLAHTVNN